MTTSSRRLPARSRRSAMSRPAMWWRSVVSTVGPTGWAATTAEALPKTVRVGFSQVPVEVGLRVPFPSEHCTLPAAGAPGEGDADDRHHGRIGQVERVLGHGLDRSRLVSQASRDFSSFLPCSAPLRLSP